MRHDRVVDQEAVVIGDAQGDHVVVAVAGRMHPESRDYWDGNWLITPIRLRVGGFTGVLAAGLRVDELRRFREDLERVYADIAGTAVLESVEDWLTLRVTCRGNGSLRVTGVARDQPGIGNRLEFALEGMDQTHLPSLIEAILRCEHRHPMLGRP
jgi:hypothetical protein